MVGAISNLGAGGSGVASASFNTMFFTQLPSNLLMVFVAFAPTLPWALVLLLLLATTSQMDVPVRHAYVVSNERIGAIAVTGGAQDDLRLGALSRVPNPPWRPRVAGSAVGDELQQIALGVAEVDAPAVSPGAVPCHRAGDQRDP